MFTLLGVTLGWMEKSKSEQLALLVKKNITFRSKLKHRHANIKKRKKKFKNLFVSLYIFIFFFFLNFLVIARGVHPNGN